MSITPDDLPSRSPVSAAGDWDANVADFPRLDGETDDAPRFLRAIAAAPNGVLRVPRGEYDIASPITIANRCSLSMHPAAHLVAGASMDLICQIQDKTLIKY